MDDLAYYLAAGVSVGAIYALIALGYTLVYGIIKLINFAHGEFYMLGAYAGYVAYNACLANQPAWLAFPCILLVSGLAGAGIALLTEWVAYKPIRKSGRLAALLTAIGVSFFLQQIMTLTTGGAYYQYPTGEVGSVGELCQRAWVVGGAGIKVVKFIYIGVAGVLTLLLWWIVTRTRFGRAMRAVSQDPEAAALMGIDNDAVIRKTFMLGGFLAGVAGSLVGFLSTIEPMMGFMPGLKAFVAAVVGGIGSIPGAVIGGFAIGLVENLVVWAGVPSGYMPVASFVVLILVLVVRPQGLLGRIRREKV